MCGGGFVCLVIAFCNCPRQASAGYFFFGRDFAWKVPMDPEDSYMSSREEEEERTIIFIRHGESMWNEIFNVSKNPFVVLPRLIRAIGLEIYFTLTASRDSIMYDSPLNTVGFQQATKLNEWVSRTNADSLSQREAEMLKHMRGQGEGPSIVVSSALRRAVSTGLVGLSGRLVKRKEKIRVLPCLQEMSRNVDTLSITPAQSVRPTLRRGSFFPVLLVCFAHFGCSCCRHLANMQIIAPSWVDRQHGCTSQDALVDVSLHAGNKPMSQRGLERLYDFVNWAFESNAKTIIVCGHSLWFRSFFKVFMPHQSKHVAKQKKMVNAGAVGFTLSKRGGCYLVRPATITPLHGGFCK